MVAGDRLQPLSARLISGKPCRYSAAGTKSKWRKTGLISKRIACVAGGRTCLHSMLVRPFVKVCVLTGKVVPRSIVGLGSAALAAQARPTV